MYDTLYHGTLKQEGAMIYYDKEGNRLKDVWEAITLRNEAEYARVAYTKIPEGPWIITRWEGEDQSPSGNSNPPMIFKTEVLSNKYNDTVLDWAVYATLEEAQAGHQSLVDIWTAEEALHHGH